MKKMLIDIVNKFVLEVEVEIDADLKNIITIEEEVMIEKEEIVLKTEDTEVIGMTDMKDKIDMIAIKEAIAIDQMTGKENALIHKEEINVQPVQSRKEEEEKIEIEIERKSSKLKRENIKEKLLLVQVKDLKAKKAKKVKKDQEEIIEKAKKRIIKDPKERNLVKYLKEKLKKQ